MSDRSTVDELTGLGNATRLTEVTQTPRPLPAARVIAIRLNINDFKRLNTLLGWQTCDRILQVVAERLQAAATPGEVFRIGSDDFVALLPAEEPTTELDRSTMFRIPGRGEYPAPSFSGAALERSLATVVDAVSGPVRLSEPLRASAEDRELGAPYGRLWRSPDGELYVSGKVYRHQSWEEVDPLGPFDTDDIDVAAVLFSVRAAASVCGAWMGSSKSGGGLTWSLSLETLPDCLHGLEWAMAHPMASVRGIE